MLVSSESLVDAVQRDAELVRLGNELRRAREALLDAQAQRASFKLEVLNLRDHAVGASARAGEMQARLTTKELELATALQIDHEKNIHIANHTAHIARLEQALSEVEPRMRELVARSAQLDRVYSSTTWRVGRLVMLPVRLLRRIFRST